MSNTGSGDFQSKYEFNSTWADRIAFLIIVGLAVDIAAVFILEKGLLEGALAISANTLIAAGVWGELWFAKRAKEAGNRIVAQALERAAKAENDLIDFLTPRRSKIRPQLEKLAGQLTQFSGTKFDIGFGAGDGEQADCCWDIEEMLRDAKWRQEQWGVISVGGAILVNDRGSGVPRAGSVPRISRYTYIQTRSTRSGQPPRH
jgi:hypothetical protein